MHTQALSRKGEMIWSVADDHGSSHVQCFKSSGVAESSNNPAERSYIQTRFCTSRSRSVLACNRRMRATLQRLQKCRFFQRGRYGRAGSHGYKLSQELTTRAKSSKENPFHFRYKSSVEFRCKLRFECRPLRLRPLCRQKSVTMSVTWCRGVLFCRRLVSSQSGKCRTSLNNVS